MRTHRDIAAVKRHAGLCNAAERAIRVWDARFCWCCGESGVQRAQHENSEAPFYHSRRQMRRDGKEPTRLGKAVVVDAHGNRSPVAPHTVSRRIQAIPLRSAEQSPHRPRVVSPACQARRGLRSEYRLQSHARIGEFQTVHVVERAVLGDQRALRAGHHEVPRLATI